MFKLHIACNASADAANYRLLYKSRKAKSHRKMKKEKRKSPMKWRTSEQTTPYSSKCGSFIGTSFQRSMCARQKKTHERKEIVRCECIGFCVSRKGAHLIDSKKVCFYLVLSCNFLVSLLSLLGLFFTLIGFGWFRSHLASTAKQKSNCLNELQPMSLNCTQKVIAHKEIWWTIL